MQCNAGDVGLIPALEDLLEKGMATHSSILVYKYTCLFVDTLCILFLFHFHYSLSVLELDIVQVIDIVSCAL